MPHDVISICPVCANDLSVTRLHCASCGTTLDGDFAVGRFGRLGRDQLALLESFLRSRGNLREMERELGLSYPTVRARVDGLVRALGLAEGPAASADGDDDEPRPITRRAGGRSPIDPRAAVPPGDRRGDRGHRDPRTSEDRAMTTTQTTDRIAHELGPTGRLTINGVDGSVDLVGTDGSEVVVHGTGRRPLEADFTVRGKPDDLKTDGHRGRRTARPPADPRPLPGDPGRGPARDARLGGHRQRSDPGRRHRRRPALSDGLRRDPRRRHRREGGPRDALGRRPSRGERSARARREDGVRRPPCPPPRSSAR